MPNQMIVSPPQRAWHAGVPTSGRAASLSGYLILFSALFGFAVWARLAPMDGAVIASGNFVVIGQNKVIQHLEGGIIKDILVREGQEVKKGETLMRLDNTAAKARLQRLIIRNYQLLIIQARLQAEARHNKKFTLPKVLIPVAKNNNIKSIFRGQTFIFDVHRDKLATEVEIFEREIGSYRERVKGAKLQLSSIKRQKKLIEEEMWGKISLLNKGLLRKSEVLALKRAQARFQGEGGRILALLGDGQQRIAKANRQILRVRTVAVQKAVEEMHKMEAERQDVRERIRAARDVLKRIEIKAPVGGVVIKMKYHTPGGVIEPGKFILELLPISSSLIIQAHIRPQDINNVKMGQEANIRLTALSSRVTPMVSGRVVYVSADTLSDDQKSSSQDVYVARVALDPDNIVDLKGFKPTPGMPAEIYIKTGERTFFEYLLQPVFDSMSRAFRES